MSNSAESSLVHTKKREKEGGIAKSFSNHWAQAAG